MWKGILRIWRSQWTDLEVTINPGYSVQPKILFRGYHTLSGSVWRRLISSLKRTQSSFWLSFNSLGNIFCTGILHAKIFGDNIQNFFMFKWLVIIRTVNGWSPQITCHTSSMTNSVLLIQELLSLELWYHRPWTCDWGQSARAMECSDCISAKGKTPQPGVLVGRYYRIHWLFPADVSPQGVSFFWL